MLRGSVLPGDASLLDLSELEERFSPTGHLAQRVIDPELYPQAMQPFLARLREGVRDTGAAPPPVGVRRQQQQQAEPSLSGSSPLELFGYLQGLLQRHQCSGGVPAGLQPTPGGRVYVFGRNSSEEGPGDAGRKLGEWVT